MELASSNSISSDAVNPSENVSPLPGVDAIENLIGQAQESAQSSRPIMQPKSDQSRKKTGRPRKNPDDPKWRLIDGEKPEVEAQPQPSIPTFDASPALTEFFRIASRVLVAKTGVEKCALYPEEIEALGASWGAVANQYAPAFLAQHGPLLAACAVTAGVGMRLNATIQAEIDKRKAEKAKDVKSEEVERESESAA